MTGLRLDKWLWFARFARTRSLAAKLCTTGAVTVSGIVIAKPGHLIRIGDFLSVHQGPVLRQVAVLALGTRRGSPAEARLLYVEREPPVALRAVEQAEWEPLIKEE
jgi:ribosome-associated heat shock protein Hsp15